MLDSDESDADDGDDDYKPMMSKKSTTQPLLSGFSINDSVGIASSQSHLDKETDDDPARRKSKVVGNALSFFNSVQAIPKLATEKLFDSDGEVIEESQTNIRWKKYITRVIDLSVMCETDMDMFSMLL